MSTVLGHSVTTTSPLIVLTTPGHVAVTQERPPSADDVKVKPLRLISTSAEATIAQAGS